MALIPGSGAYTYTDFMGNVWNFRLNCGPNPVEDDDVNITGTKYCSDTGETLSFDNSSFYRSLDVDGVILRGKFSSNILGANQYIVIKGLDDVNFNFYDEDLLVEANANLEKDAGKTLTDLDDLGDFSLAYSNSPSTVLYLQKSNSSSTRYINQIKNRTSVYKGTTDFNITKYSSLINNDKYSVFYYDNANQSWFAMVYKQNGINYFKKQTSKGSDFTINALTKHDPHISSYRYSGLYNTVEAEYVFDVNIDTANNVLASAGGISIYSKSTGSFLWSKVLPQDTAVTKIDSYYEIDVVYDDRYELNLNIRNDISKVEILYYDWDAGDFLIEETVTQIK